MHSNLRAGMPTLRVVALFPDSTRSFNLSNGATFAELADRLDRLRECHMARPTAIYVKMDMVQRPVFALQPGI